MGAVFSQCPKNCDFGQEWPFLGLIWQQKRNFSGKMTILSYKTIFGPTFSAILENLLKPFFRNVPKTAIFAKTGHFWHVRLNLGKMRIFLKKGLCYFLPLLSPNFMPLFGTILGAVSEINL